MTDAPPDNAIDARLDALLARARADRDALAEGRTPDMAALERAVGALCREIGALPRAEGQGYLEQLDNLGLALDELQAAMRGQLDGLSAELKQHGARQSAVRAYGRAGGRAPGDDRG
jgi:uncharacterized membrane protein YccC